MSWTSNVTNSFDKGFNKAAKYVDRAAEEIGDSLQKSAQAVVNSVDKGFNKAAKYVDRAAEEIGDSLQKSAQGVVSGWGIGSTVGGGGATAYYDVKTGIPKAQAVGGFMRGAGLSAVGELGLTTAIDLGQKAYNYFTGSK